MRASFRRLGCASHQGRGLFRLDGLRAVVTGGGQGIGHAVARGFLDHGCSAVHLLDLEGRGEAGAARLREVFPGAEVQGVNCDVTAEDQVLAAVQSVAPLGDAPDILVNCAGVTKREPLESFQMGDYDRLQGVNVRGAFCVSKHVGRTMLRAGRGCIINVDSLVTATQLKHVTPYSMSKSALGALTRGLALEWGQRGVRVNGLAPGFILTDISRALWDQDEMREWAMQNTPLGRMGTVEDLVGAAVFLASPASAFVNGHTIRVDGGASAGSYWPIHSAKDESTPAQKGAVHYYTGPPGPAQTFTSNPFEGTGVEQNLASGAVKRVEVDLVDGRSTLYEASVEEQLHGQGVTLVEAPSGVKDWGDHEEVTRVYHAEVSAIAQRLTGADKCTVASHIFRSVPKPGEEKPGGARPGAAMAHTDFTDTLTEQLVAMYAAGQESMVSSEKGLGLTVEELQGGRLQVLNFWRPISDIPIQRHPLAVCNPTTMTEEDLAVYSHDPQPPPKNYGLPLPNRLTVPRESPRHEWIYFSGMTVRECMVFKTYDSQGPQPSNGVGVHGAVDLLGMPAHAPSRYSIEARVLCFTRGS